MRILFFSESCWSHGTVPQGSPGFQVYIVEQTTARVRKRQLLKRSDLRMMGCERLTCEVCGRRFTQVSNLTRHVDRFHQPLTCEVCGEDVNGSHGLKQHRKGHGQTCVVCGQTFARAHGLKRHMEKQHSEEDESMEEDTVPLRSRLDRFLSSSTLVAQAGSRRSHSYSPSSFSFTQVGSRRSHSLSPIRCKPTPIGATISSSLRHTRSLRNESPIVHEDAFDRIDDNEDLIQAPKEVEQQCHGSVDDHEDVIQALEEVEQQHGGGAASTEPGRIEFLLNPFMDRRSERLGVRERHYTTRVRQMGHFATHQNLAAALREGLHTAIRNLILQNKIPDQDRIYFSLSSNRLVSNVQYLGLSAAEWLNGSDRAEAMLEKLARMLNSNENFEIDDSFHLSFTHVRSGPQGRGHKRKLKPGHTHPETFKRLKLSVVTITNKDSLCCARALVTAKAKIDGHPNWCGFKRGDKIQKEEALLLHHEASVPFGPCGYEELTAFSKTPSMYDYQLLLVDATRGYAVTSFGPPQDKQLVLLYDNNHYDVITTLPGFFGTSYFCARCLKPYNDEGRHACKNNPDRCPACRQQNCPDYTEAKCRGHSAHLPCSACKLFFYGTTCKENHMTKNYKGKAVDSQYVSVCTQRRKCPECLKILVGLKEQKKHLCGYIDCPSCQEYVEGATHQCFIQVAKSPEQEEEEKKKRRTNMKARRGAAAGLATLRGNGEVMDLEEEEDKPPLHVFFDVEAMQDTGHHVPNLVIAETEDDERPVRFKGEHCIRDFLEWLDTLTEEDTRNVTVLAHNFQGYDGYFIMNEYHQQHRIVEQVRNGAKLLQVVHDGIRFIDSLSFFQIPLSAFPKTFGLTELKKGYFPHLFNRPENQHYVGQIPDQACYMPESMSVSHRKAFEQWHDQQRVNNVIFDFQKELVEYCESDVKLLKQGCLKFKGLFEEKSKFNPFCCMTIASACNRDLRQNRMEPNTIANEPLHGWRMQSNYSKASLEWLYWEDHRLSEFPSPSSVQVRIQHAANQGEYRIPYSRYTVDGYDTLTNTAYEFQGCFWHGCPKCYPNRTERHQRLEDRCADDVYQYTQKKIQFLRDKGYKVVEMWECQWNKLKQERKDIKEFVEALDLVEPLEPRDAFYGGRTNAIQLYHKASEDLGEHIKYYDFTSLYPWVNKNGKYPLGHPIIVSQPGHTDITQFFGLAKCTVLPPQKLFHPVLPLRKNGKLTFPLCAACIEEEMSSSMLERSRFCHHTDQERQITGTWCTPEIEKAVEKGYRIVHIHEVWHFPSTRDGLFKDYVNTWLKIKEEASGWPSHVGDDPLKQRQHLTDYEAREGIRLDPTNIQKNPGLRALAKMMLNSMWGKFGQRTDKTQVKEFDDPRKFTEFLESDKYDVRYVSVLSEEVVEIHYKHKVEDNPISIRLNIFVACFTTCWARLRLYEALDLLRERVLYFDTDSVVFQSLPGQPNPPLGDYLGDFKDELSNGDYIVEFASGGPKNYGYLTKNGKQECKVRGISLNSEGSRQLNYNVLRQNVLDDIQRPLEIHVRQTEVVKPYHIVRNATQYVLETKQQTKKYQMVYNKRVIDPDTFKTYPYGYERLNQDDVEMMELLIDL